MGCSLLSVFSTNASDVPERTPKLRCLVAAGEMHDVDCADAHLI